MSDLSERQLKTLNFIRKSGGASNKEIKEFLGDVSRVTIVRDVSDLLEQKIIRQEGKGRAARYFDAAKNELLRYFDVNEYFSKTPDEREVRFLRFNFDAFQGLNDLFLEREIAELNTFNKLYQERIKKLSPALLRKEFERLTIELSWKSSRIEGNTYSLLETEILIKDQKEAEGHTREEATMILNHKKALEYISDKRSDFQKITIGKVESIQRLVVEGLDVASGLRQKPVGIIGTRYVPLDNVHQIREALEKTVQEINQSKTPFLKVLIAILMVSYIQPFEDGNKRTARLLGNALLLAHKACPLSFRSVDEVEYKKAMILFYEQNSARYFKELFIEQFKFAVNNYFLA